MRAAAPLILAVALLVAGCAAPQRSTVTGGSTSDTQAGVSVVVVLPNGTRIEHSDTSTRHATTQPSIETTGMNAKVAGGDGIGGVTLSGIPQAKRDNLILGGVFLLVAVGLWFAGQRLWAAAAGAVGVLTVLFPLWVGLICLVVFIAILIYASRNVWSQLARGIDAAKAKLPPDAVAVVETEQAKAQDVPTKRVTRAARGK
jgi:hypothetical protein